MSLFNFSIRYARPEVLDPSDPGQFEQVEAATQFRIERYLTLIDCLQDSAVSEARTIRMITKSADLEPASSIWRQLEAINERHVRVLAVFTDLRVNRRENVIRRYAAVFGSDKAKANIRFATFRNARNVIEQVQLGIRDVWAEGDRFDVFPGLVPQANDDQADDRDITAARVSFEMVWAISNEINRKDFNSF